jgi:hypothetical protein
MRQALLESTDSVLEIPAAGVVLHAVPGVEDLPVGDAGVPAAHDGGMKPTSFDFDWARRWVDVGYGDGHLWVSLAVPGSGEENGGEVADQFGWGHAAALAGWR